MLKTNDLTNGERLFLARRRAGQNTHARADELGVSFYRYNRWEKDEDTEGAPKPRLGPLRAHERSHVLRRRAGVSVQDFARVLDVSAWWLTQMEAGVVSPERLTAFWRDFPTEKGWEDRLRRKAKRAAARAARAG